MNLAKIELRLIGAMLLDDPLNADLFERIHAEMFQEPVLRAAWIVMAEQNAGAIDFEAVCERVATEFPDPVGGVRQLLAYARSDECAGVGCEARPYTNALDARLAGMTREDWVEMYLPRSVAKSENRFSTIEV